ncbi:MAG: hypothetical protein AUJ31_00105 [Parcubacteria group bacterium CG1_02_39_15]|nr:MAG: hypothetical protein AUJ31_00105 [Parcubacteria group bacterium CG1_02_39_15]
MFYEKIFFKTSEKRKNCLSDAKQIYLPKTSTSCSMEKQKEIEARLPYLKNQIRKILEKDFCHISIL